MVDTNDDVKRVRRRVEIRTGVERRGGWSDAEKGRIVAEAIAPGAVIAAVARRHELTPQHLSNPAPRPRVDSTLVKALSRAFRWRKMLEAGVFATVDDHRRR